MITTLLLSAITATSTPALADDNWLAWYGCWHTQGEASGALTCIAPKGNGVRFATVSGGTIQSETLIIADGVARKVEREGCTGTESARWSSDHQRVFITSDLKCGNIARKSSGVMSMVSASQFLDVQSVRSGEQTLVRTTRYNSAYAGGVPAELTGISENNKMARETARYAASALLDLGDVREAAKALDIHAVVEWLTATNQKFDLNGKMLVALADDGVSPDVIDVLIAISNPQMFAVSTRGNDSRDDRYGRGRRGGVISSCYDNALYDPWDYYGYNGYYNNGYAGCYGRGGYYGPWYGGDGWYSAGRPVIVVVGGSSNPLAKVTRKGYSSGRSDGSSSAGTERDTRTTSTSSSTRDNTSSSPSSSSGGSSSSSGAERTAKPRDHN